MKAKKDTDWKFRAHLGMNNGKSIRMEVKMYNGIELFREIGPGQPIYYRKEDKTNYPSEEGLIKSLTINTMKP